MLSDSLDIERPADGGRSGHRFHRAAPRVFPMGPLLAATGLSARQVGYRVRASGSDVRVAEECGLTLSQADRWAVRCGLSMVEVWPAEYADYDQLAGLAGVVG